jgi:hypothetical protein
MNVRASGGSSLTGIIIAALFGISLPVQAAAPAAPPPGKYVCFDLALGGRSAPSNIVGGGGAFSDTGVAGAYTVPNHIRLSHYRWKFMQILELLPSGRYRISDDGSSDGGSGSYRFDASSNKIVFTSGPLASSRPTGEYKGLGDSAKTRNGNVSRPRLENQFAESPYLITYAKGEENGRGDNNWHCSQ